MQDTDRQDERQTHKQQDRLTDRQTDRQMNPKDSSSGHGVPQDDRLTDGETDGKVPAQTCLGHTGNVCTDRRKHLQRRK